MVEYNFELSVVFILIFFLGVIFQINSSRDDIKNNIRYLFILSLLWITNLIMLFYLYRKTIGVMSSQEYSVRVFPILFFVFVFAIANIRNFFQGRKYKNLKIIVDLVIMIFLLSEIIFAFNSLGEINERYKKEMLEGNHTKSIIQAVDWIVEQNNQGYVILNPAPMYNELLYAELGHAAKHINIREIESGLKDQYNISILDFISGPVYYIKPKYCDEKRIQENINYPFVLLICNNIETFTKFDISQRFEYAEVYMSNMTVNKSELLQLFMVNYTN
ncbi:hypothetical protein GF327_04305 [Candidatus Woesearchaeota archaeon]|nr:hypothetical protein [Candidatus Woesearchaeota archaeon]